VLPRPHRSGCGVAKKRERKQDQQQEEHMSQQKLFKYRPNAYHHVVFATKRRKKALVGEIKERVHHWFSEIAEEYGFELLEYNSWINHVHMLIFVRPDEDLSYIMNMLKGISARRIFEEFPDLKSQLGENHLWGRRFRPEEVPESNLEKVRGYIQDQESIHTRRLGRAPIKEMERWHDLED
jgi:putative transposase